MESGTLKKIKEIYSNDKLTSKEKSEKVFKLMNPTKPTNQVSEDIECVHYTRSCQIQCPNSDCLSWYPCRFCHDTYEDHELDRYRINNIRCNFCGLEQIPNSICDGCNKEFAVYYCDLCHLWMNTSEGVYHCSKCKICRRAAEGFDPSDYEHCDTCGSCMKKSHECKQQDWIKADCPICLQTLFYSTQQTVSLNCGHALHYECFDKYCLTDYRCPICHKSVTDLSTVWEQLASLLETETLPDPYDKWQSEIQCNDCQGKSVVPFHYQYHRCPECLSYNTQKLGIIKP